MAKRCVFRRRLKVPSVSDAVTLDGKVFQARGAATKNAPSPIVARHEDGVTMADVGGNNCNCNLNKRILTEITLFRSPERPKITTLNLLFYLRPILPCEP